MMWLGQLFDSTFRQWLEYFGFKYGKATVGHTGTHAWGEIPSGLVGYVLPS
ncbi:hypothetical protein K4A83_05815 [Spirulina subsalsa FACHB-351]|uniref:Transposase n=1 Tax=Spirulina subsalsa FACHB-351 TaxID=234711 RepID=A0ABT3L2U0_9CYAN|nr:hypothetical protein [Spirulina subsalsa]MCW6035790.1 hypothetical protein [Spirulina subsalsa FACHB-351]